MTPSAQLLTAEPGIQGTGGHAADARWGSARDSLIVVLSTNEQRLEETSENPQHAHTGICNENRGREARRGGGCLGGRRGLPHHHRQVPGRQRTRASTCRSQTRLGPDAHLPKEWRCWQGADLHRAATCVKVELSWCDLVMLPHTDRKAAY